MRRRLVFLSPLLVYLGLALSLQRPHVQVRPAIVQLVGQGWLDTLAAVAGRAPRVDTMPSSEWPHRTLGWAPRDSGGRVIFLDTKFRQHWIEVTVDSNFGHGQTWTRHETTREIPADTARGIAAHEFGHETEFANPSLFRRYLALALRDSVIGGFDSDSTLRWMRGEAFADAVAASVCQRAPRCSVAPYIFTVAVLNDRQRALVDTFVAERW